MPTALWEVVQLCWAPDRMDRPHISEVLGKIRPSFQESSIRTGDVLALTSPPNTLDVDEFKRRHPTIVSLLYWSPTFLLVLYFIDWVINFHTNIDDRHSYYMKLILISRPIQISIIVQFLFAQALSNCIKQFSGWNLKKERIRMFCCTLFYFWAVYTPVWVAATPSYGALQALLYFVLFVSFSYICDSGYKY